MKTILCRIFPYDISEIIYNSLIYDYVNSALIGKINLIELMMLKITNIWNVEKNIYNLDYSEFKHIFEMINSIQHKFIVKKFYQFDELFINNLKKYCSIIEKNNEHERMQHIKIEIYDKIFILKTISSNY